MQIGQEEVSEGQVMSQLFAEKKCLAWRYEQADLLHTRQQKDQRLLLAQEMEHLLG